MRFLKDIVGGLLIMAVATGIGVAHNAVRGKPMTLVLRIPAPTAPKTTEAAKQRKPTAAPEEAKPDASDDDLFSDAEDARGMAAVPNDIPEVTQEELVAGEVTMDRLHTILHAGTAILIDARSEHEFEEGHLPGAMNVPYEKLVEYSPKLVDFVPMDATVICYCRSVDCDLSDDLALELRLMGYANVVLYRGGWDEWTEAGFETEGGEGSEGESRQHDD